MRLGDTPEEAAFRAEVRQWLAGIDGLELRDGTTSLGFFDFRSGTDHDRAARAWQRRKATAGWGCIAWPVEYGGRGGTLIEQLVWDQEEEQYLTPPNMFSVGLGMVGPTLMQHGSPAQRSRFIEPLLRGDELWCQLFSEPDAGSDLAAVRTRAVRDGADWVVHGHKIWTSRANLAEWGLLLARTDTQSRNAEALTCFAVDMSAPGIAVSPIRQPNGQANFCEVRLDGVRLGDALRVGEVGDGWAVARTTLTSERIYLGSRGERDAAFCFRNLVALARATTTSRDGSVALDNPAVRERLASFYIRVRGAEFTRYRVLTAMHDGVDEPAARIVKLVCSTVIQEMADFAVDLLSDAVDTSLPAAFGPGQSDWHEIALKAPSLRIGGGTDEILRDVLADRVLGLPRN